MLNPIQSCTGDVLRAVMVSVSFFSATEALDNPTVEYACTLAAATCHRCPKLVRADNVKAKSFCSFLEIRDELLVESCRVRSESRS